MIGRKIVSTWFEKNQSGKNSENKSDNDEGKMVGNKKSHRKQMIVVKHQKMTVQN